MGEIFISDKQALTLRSLKLVKTILDENPEIREIINKAENVEVVKNILVKRLKSYLEENRKAKHYFNGTGTVNDLSWTDIGVIRLLNYIKYDGSVYPDPNRQSKLTVSSPIRNLFLAAKSGKGNGNKDFFLDMLYLFRQINGKLKRKLPSEQKIKAWMAKYPSGLAESVVENRKKNKERILRTIIEEIDAEEHKSARYFFEEGLSEDEKYRIANKWWDDYMFHLRFAIRSPEKLNKYLDYSMRQSKMNVLTKAYNDGIPFFITPYYLSLFDVDVIPGKSGFDRTLRDYVFHSRELVEAFGNIIAWEKEDIVEPGKPNAAGWILPEFHNIHRRYPEVAIFIPDTRGRACAGLCVSCQRMYDFQSGHLNFNLDKLEPKISWSEKMKILLKYFEDDTQLRDILITGGDSFMNTDESLQEILDGVYEMALRKRKSNKRRASGEKYAEIIRVRLGTRIPAYLPKRVTKKFASILSEFKEKASKIGIKQFIIQIHVQSAMEITPESKKAIARLTHAGWLVANQLVFTAAASRRGHTNKLRKVLNDIGVISYYTFSVKGFMENYHNFATNERSVQEKEEEKVLSKKYPQINENIAELHSHTTDIQSVINNLRKQYDLSFLPTDRNILNLPGVGKSMTYNTIGITNDGRRILEFEHDVNRRHSPAVKENEKVIIIESKSISDYLKQMEVLGENPADYISIWGYSISETEERAPVFNYSDYEYDVTEEMKNFQSPK